MMNLHKLHISLPAIVMMITLIFYSTACSRSANTTGFVTATVLASPVSSKTSTPVPSPTEPTSTVKPPSTPTPVISTATPSLPTSAWKDGWVDFINAYYGYAISLPPAAIAEKGEINTIPGAAQSLTFEELKAMYPPGMCVGISYGTVDLTIRAANWLGGEFGGPCSRTGIGVVHPVWTQEEIVVGETSYPATHGEMYESSAPDAKLVEEFYYVDLGEGALVYFGSKMGGWPDQAAYEQYLNDKEIVLDVLRSFRTIPRDELYCPDPAPTRLKAADFAHVSNDPPQTPNNVRSEPGINQPLLGSIAPGTVIEILEGPVCNNSLQWFRVRGTDTGLEGWTPEGDHDSYWLIPCESKENCG